MLKSTNSVPKSKFWIIVGIVIMLHLVVVYRFFQLQILDFELYSKRAESNRIRAISIPAPRGLILDRHG